MARWKSLLLAGALGCWPALGFAQATLPVPPAPPTGDGVPALPPGAPTSISVAGPAPVMTSAPGRVTLADRGAYGNNFNYAVPDVTGMPKPEGMGNRMYTSFDGNAPTTFAPQGAFCPQAPAGCDTCGSILPATGPCGLFVGGGLTWYHVRRNDPAFLFTTTTFDVNGNPVTSSVQSDFDDKTGTGYWASVGYLFRDGWFGEVTYKSYRNTISSNNVQNTGADPNLVIQFIGPGPLGSGAGGGDVPIGGFLQTHFGFNWNNLDVMSGVVISPARCLDVIFSGGVRFSKIDQDYNAFIDHGDGSSNNQLLHTELEGVGSRIGFEMRAYPVSCVMFYGKAYANMLLSNRKEEANVAFNAADGTASFSLATYQKEEVLPSIDLTVGAEVGLFGGRLLIGGGYEFNYLWEAGSTFTEQASNPRAARHVNLAIDGLVAHVTWLW
jgi:hypothetical protein